MRGAAGLEKPPEHAILNQVIINRTRSSRVRSRTGRWLGALIALAFVSLASPPSLIGMQAPASPARWEGGAALADAPDVNPDPRIVEINLEARVADVEIATGQRVAAWTYNGGLPGPLIRVRVGDRLIVHFTNRLPKPTTVHWHGLRVPIQMDGVPGISQPDVAPGSTFTYDFVVPDAGLYWYHPHVMSAAQVGFGLYGALLVDDPAESFSTPIDEVVMVLSDIEIDQRGTLEDPDSGGSTGMAFGREGNHVLVNGREQPTLLWPGRRGPTMAHRQRCQEPLFRDRSGRSALYDNRR